MKTIKSWIYAQIDYHRKYCTYILLFTHIVCTVIFGCTPSKRRRQGQDLGGGMSSRGGRGIIQGRLIDNDTTPPTSLSPLYPSVRTITLRLIHTTLCLTMLTATAASNGYNSLSSSSYYFSSSSYFFYSSSNLFTSSSGLSLFLSRALSLVSLFSGVCQLRSLGRVFF